METIISGISIATLIAILLAVTMLILGAIFFVKFILMMEDIKAIRIIAERWDMSQDHHSSIKIDSVKDN